MSVCESGQFKIVRVSEYLWEQQPSLLVSASVWLVPGNQGGRCTGEDTTVKYLTKRWDEQINYGRSSWFLLIFPSFATLEHTSMCSSLSRLRARWQRCCVSHQETWRWGVTQRCGDTEWDNRQCCSRWCLFSQHPAPVLELAPSCLQSVRQYLTLQMNDYKGKYDSGQTREKCRQQILPIAQPAPGGCNCVFMLYPTKITEESHSSMWTWYTIYSCSVITIA